MNKFPLILFQRKNLLSTILVIAATLVLIRLGIWQLDRLEKRRAFNERVVAQIEMEPLQLSDLTFGLDLVSMEYRKVIVSGVYDQAGEIALRNQVWHDHYGAHLLTPLRIDGTDQYILVDRGWIPGEDFSLGMDNGGWSEFAEPGQVTVRGVFRRSQSKADFGSISDPTPVPGADPVLAWNLVNIEQIQLQTSDPLLPVYIQQAPDNGWDSLPYRSQPEVEISEGSHLSYAIQWFTFASILFFGYPFYLRRSEGQNPKDAEAVPGEKFQFLSE
jgi:surfeit locus 1 family protein